MMLPYPPPPPYPDMQLDPPGVFFQILLCVLFVYLWFETVVLFLPDKLQQIVSSWQFGPHWTAKRKGDQ
jgi:hypothetical protein